MPSFLFLEYLEQFFQWSHLDSSGIPIESDLLQLIHERAKKVRAYILSSAAQDRVRTIVRTSKPGDTPFLLPIPFEAVWIEGMSTTGDVEDDEERGPFIPCFIEFPFKEKRESDDDLPALACGVLISRVGDQYMVSCVQPNDPEHREAARYKATVKLMGEADLAMESLVQTAHNVVFHIFNNFRDNFVLGSENINARVRTGKGASRALLKVKDIVHIVNRTEKQRMISKGNEIDWSHRWEVMGHWRKIAGIGKDQNGSYRIKGHTWVSPHVKGPESKELVPKTRFVRPTDADPAYAAPAT